MLNGLLVFLISVILSSLSWAGSAYKVGVSKHANQHWQIQHLVASRVDGSVKVIGRVTTGLPMKLPRGHIDIAAYSPEGRLLLETTTNYVPEFLTHSMIKRGGLQFSAILGETLPADTLIKVAFHRNDPRDRAKPSHLENIAK